MAKVRYCQIKNQDKSAASFCNKVAVWARNMFYNYHVRNLSTLLYKYNPATEFTKLGSTPFKDGTTLEPKLANPLSFWRSGSIPFKYWIKYSWSGSTHILYYINMSGRWNTLLRNMISSCQHVFYYKTFIYWKTSKLQKTTSTKGKEKNRHAFDIL